MRRFAALTAAVALTAAAAPVPLAAAKTTQATFSYRANTACSDAGAKIEALPAGETQTVVKEFRALVKINAALVKRLNGIEAPASSKRQYRKFININRQQLTLVQQALTSARQHHVDHTAALLFKVVKLGQQGETVATDLDLSDCNRSYYPGASSTATA
jgi:hypothetical protein